MNYTVKELITALQAMPQDAQVKCIVDNDYSKEDTIDQDCDGLFLLDDVVFISGSNQ